jgi:hypothetical protein
VPTAAVPVESNRPHILHWTMHWPRRPTR